MPQALKRIENQTPFVTVKHLSAKQLNSIVIPLPALDIQHRISSVLDRASDLISLRKRQLAKLDELVKARFVEMFHDDYPIGDAKNFKFPLPPLKLQNQYGNFVEQIDKSRLTIQQSLAKLEVLKKALMQEYFG